MPRLTPACALVRQSRKWDGLFFPVLLAAQIWHPPTTTSLALQRMRYVDAILQMTRNLSCFEVEAADFTALVYSALLGIGKSVLKTTEIMWKNSAISKGV
jgi:hypothetical protein